MTKHDNNNKENYTITAIEGIRVGHATDQVARTGCTVILCESGAVAGVDVRGSAPGTRETDAIRPGRLVQKAHAVLLTGGSAFGLDATGGVMRYLEERSIGFPAGPVRGADCPKRGDFRPWRWRCHHPSQRRNGLSSVHKCHEHPSRDRTSRCWHWGDGRQVTRVHCG